MTVREKMKELEQLKDETMNKTEKVIKGMENLPAPIVDLLDAGANAYSESTATTNAGRVLRFISKFIKPSTIIKLFAHKFSNK
jgi:hypothetical protein